MNPDFACKCGHKYSEHQKDIASINRFICIVPANLGSLRQGPLSEWADDCLNFEPDSLNFFKKRYEELTRSNQ